MTTIKRVCPQCFNVSDVPANRAVDCPKCRAKGHLYRMLAFGDMDRARAVRARHPMPKVAEKSLAQLERAERALCAALFDDTPPGEGG